MTQKETIQNWIDKSKQSLIANYIKLGLKSSGNWGEQLEGKQELIDGGDGIRITFLGSSYTQKLVAGRRANTNKDSIRAFVGWAGSTFLADWVKNKGLNISPFAVAYKIAREGIKVPNSRNPGTIVSDVINTNSVEMLMKDLFRGMASDIKTDIKTQFNGN